MNMFLTSAALSTSCCHCDCFTKYIVYIENKASIQDIDDNVLISANHEIIVIMTAVCRHQYTVILLNVLHCFDVKINLMFMW